MFAFCILSSENRWTLKMYVTLMIMYMATWRYVQLQSVIHYFHALKKEWINLVSYTDWIGWHNICQYVTSLNSLKEQLWSLCLLSDWYGAKKHPFFSCCSCLIFNALFWLLIVFIFSFPVCLINSKIQCVVKKKKKKLL